jgi:hypothetical protein
MRYHGEKMMQSSSKNGMAMLVSVSVFEMLNAMILC